jgi:hypothetical protein
MKLPFLRTITVGYLLLPNVIFIAGWFGYQYSIPVVLGFIFLFYSQFKNTNSQTDVAFPLRDTSILLLCAMFWTFSSGTSGLSFQIADYWAHNAKFYDLFNNPWPTYFAEKGQYACYYFGYFIVPAFVSKLLGHLSPTTLFVWTTIGYWLGLMWMYVLLKQKKRLILALLFVGGIGHLIKVLFYQLTDFQFHIAPFYTEIWSIYDQSLWVTNQIIPIILIASVFTYDVWIKKRLEDSFFLITLGFLWAIFPSIIFVVLFGILFVNKYIRDYRLLLTKTFIKQIILPGLIFIPTFIYFLSSDSIQAKGFIWQFEPTWKILAEYFVGTVLDIILFFLLSRLLKKNDNLIPGWFLNAVFVVFLLMSLYRIGRWNDWFIRGYIPLMFIILVSLIRSLDNMRVSKKWNKSLYFNVLVILLLLGSIIPAGHVVRSLRHNVIVNRLLPGSAPFEPIPYDNYRNTYEAVTEKSSDGEIEAQQYLSARGSVYEKFFSRHHSENLKE